MLGGWVGALLVLAVMAVAAYVLYQVMLPYLPWAVGGAVLLLWARMFLFPSR
jgi:hypothetical protein